jgi:hypothetical protein
MPAMTTRGEVPSGISFSAEGRGFEWQKLVERADPLAAWKAEFAEWRNEVGSFRKFEQDVFFVDPTSAFAVRCHRGFLSSLLSRGELLALEILENEAAASHLHSLDVFLKNLQATMDTWHSLEERTVLEGAKA